MHQTFAMATLIPDRVRSATEYSFNEDQTEAIIRTVAYHRHDFPQSVIFFSEREHDKIRSSIATPIQRSSNVGLGSLDRLPLELLIDILDLLDMQSLFQFRQTNLRSRQTVDSLSQYQRAVSHGLNLFCAMLRTKLATDISLLDFDRALCTKTCVFCGQFGGFISILAWKRCCFKCLQESPETQVRSLASVERYLCPIIDESRQLRSFKSLPGTYSMRQLSQKSHIQMVSLDQATMVVNRPPDTLPPIIGHVYQRTKKANSMGSCALPYYDKQTGKVERGISCAGCQISLERNTYVSSTAGVTRLLHVARDKEYAQDGFLNHFRWCQNAQLIWKASGEGETLPAALPELAQSGYLSGWRRRT